MNTHNRETLTMGELRFLRCDKDGNEIPMDVLRNLNYTNSTIDKIVSETAGRIEGGREFSQGLSTF